MILLHILWPTFAMVLLTFAVMLTVASRRLRLVKATPPRRDDFASVAASQRYFQPVENADRNLSNLFEMPVLFFALVPLLMGTQQAGIAQVVLAWFYVICRAAHSWIHLGGNDVRRRFRAFLLSNVVLAAMWIGFFVDFVRAAATYQRALGIALHG
ncbi:MAPEG family protein [Sphingomonas rubra]|uniref:MAPEG family protein n=1 Tax=Sphingomonas rubra TaxID=634430 RepID=A0A1I5SR62_9SPHN|nr:MAPEG family protein [Sphingomonas rubra]SFP73205.1 hypothetical protein SAMN04488241_10678 [Sphingomonas rubra]